MCCVEEIFLHKICWNDCFGWKKAWLDNQSFWIYVNQKRTLGTHNCWYMYNAKALKTVWRLTQEMPGKEPTPLWRGEVNFQISNKGEIIQIYELHKAICQWQWTLFWNLEARFFLWYIRNNATGSFCVKDLIVWLWKNKIFINV